MWRGALPLLACVAAALAAPTTTVSSSSSDGEPDPCRVAGIYYSHGQQVPRVDPCEFCLCLDGELFCWWQECPPPAGPCKGGATYVGCANSTESSESPSTALPITTTEPANTSDPDAAVNSTATSSWSSSETSTGPTTCYVMGTEYKIGEVLPRDTGTCLECICDAEARVTCSPKDCTSRDDFHGNSLDMFDVDTF